MPAGSGSRAELRRIFVENRRHRLRGRVATKRADARQQFVQNGAEGEQIRAMIDGESADLLGRHVADGAEHHTRLRRRGQRGECARCRRRRLTLRQLRQPEVENLDAAIPGNEDVLRLEITMEDALSVRRLEPARDLKGMLDRLANSDRAAIQPVAKRLPFEQLGYDERRFGMGADVVHGEDVRVVQRRRGAGFLLESMQAIDVGRKCRGKDFDRNMTSESRIAGPIHLTHPAGAEHFLNFIRAESVPGGQ